MKREVSKPTYSSISKGRGFVVIDRVSGQPFGAFIAEPEDNINNVDDAMKKFYQEAREHNIPKHLLSQLDLEAKEIPYELAMKLGVTFANKGNDVMASFLELKDYLTDKEQNDLQSGDYIDAEYTDITGYQDRRLPSPDKEIEEVCKLAGC